MKTGSALLLAASLACAGCALVGPASISNGRGVYSDVINNTEDEQLLKVIVLERFGQTFGMLTVSSVTASIKVSATAGAQAGVGSKQAYEGNLVPLAVGVAYEENPTISYVPLSGEAFLSRMLAPITPPQATLLLGAANGDGAWIREMCRRINGMENPAHRAPSPALKRFAALESKLRRAGVMEVGTLASSDALAAEYFVRISGYRESHLEQVRELLAVLGLKEVKADGSDIVLPIYITAGNGHPNAINLQLRSTLDIIRDVGRTIQVPAEQVKYALPLEASDPDEEQLMTIRASKSAPEDAVVAIPFRGWWYYIDATDARSKRAFKLLRLMVGLRLEEKASDRSAPVLTIPAR
ncbi:MAG TPA: hypothetical protein VMJ14_16515 [Burkholderiales bacterium]|nr:hypothetical protein [Burkholderiales bacterium]